MAVDEASKRTQPEPERDYSLEGATALQAADFERVWWHMPGPRRARAVLIPALALTAFSGLILAPIPELSWSVSLVPFGLVLLLYVAVSAARRGFAKLQLERLGPGAVEYRLDGDGAQLHAAGVAEGCRWTELRGFLDAADAFLLYPKAGRFLLLPKRAFGAGTEHVRWFLTRRARELHPPRWGLRLAFGVVGLMVFLTAWHFLSPGAELSKLERGAEAEQLERMRAELRAMSNAAGSAAPVGSAAGTAP